MRDCRVISTRMDIVRLDRISTMRRSACFPRRTQAMWTRCRALFSLSIFFFFQAEDGIRDLTVTGVQTCALPIFLMRETQPIAAQAHHSRPALEPVNTEAILRRRDGGHRTGVGQLDIALHAERSEERRVGKECRSRWSPYH